MPAMFVVTPRALLCVWVVAAPIPPGKVVDRKPIVAEGASFSEPRGWTRAALQRESCKGWFLSPDRTPEGSPKAMIMLDIVETGEKDAKTSAESLARAWGGNVAEKPTSLDGEAAWRVQYAKPESGCRPIEGVIALRKGKLYVLMGAVCPGRSVADELEELRKGWKWVE
jgi:hypothetical protein